MGGNAQLFRRLIRTAIAICAIVPPSIAQANISVETSAPAGFSDLEATREQVVDVYFEGELIAVETVRITPGHVEFLDVAALFSMLPRLREPETVLRRLSQPLRMNADRICPRGVTIENCGFLAPETVGVIYTSEQFRIDIFINPALLAERLPLPRFLDQPNDDWSIISSNALSFQSNGLFGGADINFRNDSIMSLGRARLRSSLNYSKDVGLNFDEAALEYDTNTSRYTAGLFWAPGIAQIGRTQVLGLSYTSQLDVRRDNESLIGTPLVVYLRERGRVEVYLEKRLLFAETLSAGSHTINTASFPQGSYNLDLQIAEGGRPPRTEQRFYTKNRDLPAIGSPSYYVTAGIERDPFALRNDFRNEDLLLRGGAGWRLSSHLAVGTDVETRLDNLGAELNVNLVSPVIQGRAAVYADTSGARIYSLGVGSSGLGILNYNFDLRHVTLSERESDQYPSTTFGLQSYTQASGSASLLLGNIRLGTLGTWRETNLGRDYSLGLAARWDILRASRWSVGLVSDATLASSGNSAFVGVSIQLLGSRGALTSSFGYSHRPLAASRTQSGFDASIYGSGAISLGRQTQLQGSAGFEREPGRTAYSISGELQASQFELIADALVTEALFGRTEQYGLGGRSTLFANSGGIRFSGKSATESSIVVKVSGARADDRFEILINGQPRGWLDGDEEAVFIVPTYRAYEVRVRPDTTGALAIDTETRNISLYPGNVARLTWQVDQRMIVFGQLVDTSGAPITNASIALGREISVTDDHGLFQIEAASGDILVVRDGDGKNYRLVLGDLGNADFTEIGAVVASPVEEGSE